ncbi:unnamed protein product [Diatraea saccharalis]|uniref:Uncharacterized protein n=1 Tax=Diatraea saccharalis TaxID=40085 RepID=A0A9N9QVA4_9NEOP|nr:unnamed protein product [Diatraea saccharalis]
METKEKAVEGTKESCRRLITTDTSRFAYIRLKMYKMELRHHRHRPEIDPHELRRHPVLDLHQVFEIQYAVLHVLFDANKNELLPDLTNEDALPEDLEAHMIDVMASDTLTLDLEIISDDDTPLVSLKITKQLQELTNRRQNINSKIYNSESDKSYSSDKEPSASYDINAKIGRGDFLLVKLYVDASKNKSYTYACKTLTEIEDDGEIQVMFLRVVDENAKRFRLDKKDISYVNHENIVKKLPVPALVKKGEQKKLIGFDYVPSDLDAVPTYLSGTKARRGVFSAHNIKDLTSAHRPLGGSKDARFNLS